MKALTHKGAILTLPFTLTTSPGSEFEQLDGNGTATVGIVTNVDDALLRRNVQQAARLEQACSTARQITGDLQYIARSLLDIADGTEIRVETKGARTKLVIPESARPKREPVKQGDRVAVNAEISPKTLMNAHGTVETVKGNRATVKLDDGDRQRVIRAGRDVTPSVRLPVGVLDKLDNTE